MEFQEVLNILLSRGPVQHASPSGNYYFRFDERQASLKKAVLVFWSLELYARIDDHDCLLELPPLSDTPNNDYTGEVCSFDLCLMILYFNQKTNNSEGKSY